ncbi:MAG: FecR family protein [Phocaeicola sp.]
MTEDMFKNITEQLHHYASNKATRKELRALKESLNRENDESLKPVLEEEWERCQTSPPLSSLEKQLLFQKIKQKSKSQLIPNKQLWRFQVAASIIIILLTTISTYFYTNNLKMSQLGERNIVVKVGHGERVSMTLPDGTQVRLNSESELSYQQNFGLVDRQVTLTGEGYFDVTQNKKKRFVVHTRFFNIEVLGTIFNVHAYEKNDLVEMALVKGHVLVSTINEPHQKYHVNPCEKVIYDKKTGRIQVQPSSNKVETAWVSNELVFRSVALSEVLSCIERKYEVTFNIDKNISTDDHYTGFFDEIDIHEVMDILKKNFNFDYQIKKDTIWINSIPSLK